VYFPHFFAENDLADAELGPIISAKDAESEPTRLCQRRIGSSPTARTDPDNRSEVAMADDKDDVFDEDGQTTIDDYDRLSEILMARVGEFAEDEDVADGLLSPLLFRLALTTRMVDYAATAAKPSGSGLKLDLDRFRRLIEDIIREAKKDADTFIAQAKESIAAAELEEDES
jgi:hypothetical protein